MKTHADTLRSSYDALRTHALWLLDLDARIVTITSAAEALYGYEATEIAGRPFASLFQSERDQRSLSHDVLASLGDTDWVEVDTWHVHKNGARFPSNIIVSPALDIVGKRIGYIAIGRNVTGRSRAESLLRSVLDNAHDGIVTIDAFGTIQSINRAAERIFGYTAAEVAGRDITQLMPEAYRERHRDQIATYLRTGVATIIGTGREVVGLRKDGATFPMSLAVSEFEYDGARHFTGIVRDVTQERLLENQFRQAQKMEAVGQLAGGVAHDFNNLLTVMSGYCELLQTELPAESPLQEFALQISRAADRAATLTNQLLAFSRQTVLQPRVIDLREIITDTADMLRRLIGEDIELSTFFDESTPSVNVDPSQLAQVLMNLAVNSRDAMPRGGKLTIETRAVELTPAYVTTHAYATAGLFAMIAVSDTGVGMTPEVRARIFEPFYTTKGPGRGTGLGLATVYGMIKQSGGVIEVYSEVGIGTTFKIFLPAADGTPFVEERQERKPLAGSERLLLVEDEAAVREITLRALTQQGYQVTAAANGIEALRIVKGKEASIDLLVTDVVMPELSGRELSEKLRAARPDLRVLFLSGYTDDAIVRHGILQSKVAFLQKPFTPTTLARKVRQVLDGE